MRLTCPNCSAQYEVPEDAIPDAGRDVQCSNCAHTWYQLHPEQEAAIEATRADQGLKPRRPDSRATPATTAPKPVSRPVPVPDPEPEVSEDDDAGLPELITPTPVSEPVAPSVKPATVPVPAATAATATAASATVGDKTRDVPEARMIEIHDDDSDDDGYDFGDEDTARAPAAAPRELDPRVRDVLRAEAAREERARANDAAALESQPDLGLEDTTDAGESRRRRDSELASAGAAAVAAGGVAVAAAAKRGRDRLPDIDEINSTLRSTSERRDAKGDEPTFEAIEESEKRRSFGRGFRWALLLIVILVALYIFGPRIIEALPASAAVLQPYLDIVDGGRVWLDGRVGDMLARLDTMSSEAGSQ